MLTTHPRVIRDAFVLRDTIVLSAHDRTHIRYALDVISRLGLKPDVDYTFAANVTVQTPCALTPLKGQHVQHREFTDQHGDSVSAFYRFPAHTRTSEVVAWFKANGIRHETEECYHSYDCCGNWYCHGWSITARRGHILVQVFYGRNV